VSYVTHHPAVLEHTLRWQDLSEIEQDALIEAVKTNNATKLRTEVFDVVMPCYFTIPFPLARVNPQAGADALGRLQVLVEPRASSGDAAPQTSVSSQESSGVEQN
jgi:hypothetical protein